MTDKFEQLKQKYISSFEQKYNDIESAWGEKDFPQLEYLLHKLAGSSGSYGFTRLNHLCSQAETAMKENQHANDESFTDLMNNILKLLKSRS